MSEKAQSRDLTMWNYEQGNRLAREAETGSTDKVNQELSKVRSQLSPKEYNDLINSIQSANTAHVGQDKYDLEGKRVKSLTIPTLIFADSLEDKDNLPDHIARRSFYNGNTETFAEPKPQAKPAKRVGADGNYPFPFNVDMAVQAHTDVLNPPERRK